MLNILSNQGVWDNVIDSLLSVGLWSAVSKSIIIILLGFFLTKKGIFTKDTPRVLTKVVLVAALPCLAFTGFMADITQAEFLSAIFAFVWGFIIYTIFIFLSKLLFIKFSKEKRMVCEMLFIFGSTTFFAQPLIQAIFPGAYLHSNMFNIAYRVFLYSYGFLLISKPKVDSSEIVERKQINVKDVCKTIFLNPIVIATFLGFFLWSMQLVCENVDWVKVTVDGKTGVFWRLDILCPPINSTLSLLGSLSSPLVWLAIGGTLASVSFKEAASDKSVWIYSFIKVIGAPIINLLLLFIINLFITVDINIVIATTLMWATPPATTIVSFCINYDKEALFASNCSFISTVVAVACIPFYVVLITVLQSSGIFG
ncbi:MAG: AEC family transporter [bacterium]